MAGWSMPGSGTCIGTLTNFPKFLNEALMFGYNVYDLARGPQKYEGELVAGLNRSGLKAGEYLDSLDLNSTLNPTGQYDPLVANLLTKATRGKPIMDLSPKNFGNLKLGALGGVRDIRDRSGDIRDVKDWGAPEIDQIRDITHTGLSTPGEVSDYFKEAVADPLMTQFKEEIIPQINDSMAARGALFGSNRANTTRLAARDLDQALASKLGDWQMSNQQLEAKLTSAESTQEALLNEDRSKVLATLLEQHGYNLNDLGVRRDLGAAQLGLQGDLANQNKDWQLTSLQSNRDLALLDANRLNSEFGLGLISNMGENAWNRALTAGNSLINMSNMPMNRLGTYLGLSNYFQQREDQRAAAQYNDWLRQVNHGQQLYGNMSTFAQNYPIEWVYQQPQDNSGLWGGLLGAGATVGTMALTGGLSAPASVAGGVGSIGVGSAPSAGFTGPLNANNIGNGIQRFGLYY